MKRFLLLSLGAVAWLPGTSFAADLVPVKVPPLAAPVVTGWTGFYAGLNAGGAWNSNNSVSTTSHPVQGFEDGIGPGSWAFTSALGATGNVSTGSKAAFIGGGQIGYNSHFAPAWVAGVEVDIQGIPGSRQSGVSNSVGSFPTGTFSVDTMNTRIASSRQIDYLGTVRGRLGYLWAPTLLVYGTGGFAYGGVKASTAISQSNDDCTHFPADCVIPLTATRGSLSDTATGWTAGGGLEWLFQQRWSAKVEYLYYDLGRETFSDGRLITSSGTFVQAGGPVIVASRSAAEFNGNIVRAGINYHF